MEALTLQQVFDNAWNAYVVRGEGGSVAKRGLDGPFACRYRGENGCKCALGHSIPDEQYAPDKEQLLPDTDAGFTDDLPVFDGIDESKLRALQVVHDSAALGAGCIPTPEIFEERIEPSLRKYATKYGLTIPNSKGGSN